jgi:hypothetical protein
MKTVCDTGSTLCPHKPQCAHLCHFTDAGLEEMETRKVKPYPAVPDDIEPVPEVWQVIASIAVGFVLFAIAVVAAVAFVTGAWVWSLLI